MCGSGNPNSPRRMEDNDVGDPSPKGLGRSCWSASKFLRLMVLATFFLSWKHSRVLDILA